jgi:hypothetical protein
LIVGFKSPNGKIAPYFSGDLKQCVSPTVGVDGFKLIYDIRKLTYVMISNVVIRPVMKVYYIQRMKCAEMKVRYSNQARSTKGFERK